MRQHKILQKIERIRSERGKQGRQARSASRIKALPSADVVPVVHGYWFVDERPESDREVICSVCEEPVFKYHDHIDWRLEYCPHCGAKMDGGDEHETN